MTKPNVVYHIGYPKTGTTTIQHYLRQQRGENFDAVLQYEPEFFEFIGFVRGHRLSSDTNKISITRPVIYSAEEISVTFLRVKDTNFTYFDFQPLSINQVLDRILEFHDFKFGPDTPLTLMIGLRKLKAFLPSWYAQFHNRHMPENKKTFMDLCDYCEQNPSLFDHNLIVQQVEKKFKNVIIYNQETLFGNSCNLIRDLQNLAIDIRVGESKLNVRKKARGVYTMRYTPFGARASKLGRYIPKPIKRSIRGFVFQRKIQDFVSKTWTMSEAEKRRLDEVCKF